MHGKIPDFILKPDLINYNHSLLFDALRSLGEVKCECLFIVEEAEELVLDTDESEEDEDEADGVKRRKRKSKKPQDNAKGESLSETSFTPLKHNVVITMIMSSFNIHEMHTIGTSLLVLVNKKDFMYRIDIINIQSTNNSILFQCIMYQIS